MLVMAICWLGKEKQHNPTLSVFLSYSFYSVPETMESGRNGQWTLHIIILLGTFSLICSSLSVHTICLFMPQPPAEKKRLNYMDIYMYTYIHTLKYMLEVTDYATSTSASGG